MVLKFCIQFGPHLLNRKIRTNHTLLNRTNKTYAWLETKNYIPYVETLRPLKTFGTLFYTETSGVPMLRAWYRLFVLLFLSFIKCLLTSFYQCFVLFFIGNVWVKLVLRIAKHSMWWLVGGLFSLISLVGVWRFVLYGFRNL